MLCINNSCNNVVFSLFTIKRFKIKFKINTPDSQRLASYHVIIILNKLLEFLQKLRNQLFQCLKLSILFIIYCCCSIIIIIVGWQHNP